MKNSDELDIEEKKKLEEINNDSTLTLSDWVDDLDLISTGGDEEEDIGSCIRRTNITPKFQAKRNNYV
jgi:hypothetical protein